MNIVLSEATLTALFLIIIKNMADGRAYEVEKHY
jgi:hypothetical protein